MKSNTVVDSKQCNKAWRRLWAPAVRVQHSPLASVFGAFQPWLSHRFLPFLGAHYIAALRLFLPCQLLALISLFQFSWDVVVSWDSLHLLSHLQKRTNLHFFLFSVWRMTANRKQFFQAQAEMGLKLILLMHSLLSFRGCQTHMFLYNLLLKHTSTQPPLHLPVFIHSPLIT